MSGVTAAIDEDAEIRRLAKLKPLDYDRERKAAAKLLGLGIRVSILDKLVKAERGESNDSTTQGRPIALADPEPWPEVIEGAELLADIVVELERYMVMEPGAAEIAALWALHTHALDAFGISPRLAITSPRLGCGKTTLLDILKCLVPRPLLMANITGAAVFRTIELAAPVLLADEADTWLTQNDELRGILNSGHRRGGSVIRTVGDGFEPRQFATWGACAIAMIGNLPSTLADRSVPITLKRKRPDELVEQFRGDRTAALDILARKAARWANDNRDRLASKDSIVPDKLDNRAADNWRPLLAIAEVAGGEWPTRARGIAAATVDADQAKHTGLLADIREIFTGRRADRLSSDELTQALVALEGRPWGRTTQR